MSNVSTVYDTLITIVDGLFSDKKRLPNPYNILENDSFRKKLGWGLKMGPSTIGTIDLFNKHVESREFSIVFTKLAQKLKNAKDGFDDPAKGLIEDNNTLMVRLLNNDQIGIPSAIGIIEFVGNSGMELLEDDKSNYISTETTFKVDIMEDI